MSGGLFFCCKEKHILSWKSVYFFVPGAINLHPQECVKFIALNPFERMSDVIYYWPDWTLTSLRVSCCVIIQTKQLFYFLKDEGIHKGPVEDFGSDKVRRSREETGFLSSSGAATLTCSALCAKTVATFRGHKTNQSLNLNLGLFGSSGAWPSSPSVLKENWLTFLVYWLWPFQTLWSLKRATMEKWISCCSAENCNHLFLPIFSHL